jgi:hypothetical protein
MRYDISNPIFEFVSDNILYHQTEAGPFGSVSMKIGSTVGLGIGHGLGDKEKKQTRWPPREAGAFGLFVPGVLMGRLTVCPFALPISSAHLHRVSRAPRVWKTQHCGPHEQSSIGQFSCPGCHTLVQAEHPSRTARVALLPTQDVG